MSELAQQYNEGMDWVFESFGLWEPPIREKMASLIKGYGKVLEVGCGTGRDTVYLKKQVLNLTATDILQEMVEETKRVTSLRDCQVCDVHDLPFEKETFDCVFHFGAFNTFKDRKQALKELDRVTAYGGKVIIGDEGLAPWLRDTTYGRMLIKANPLYLNEPPLYLLPEHAHEVRLHWLIGNAFYLIEYSKYATTPKVNENLPIPGPRGGTLRTRYES